MMDSSQGLSQIPDRGFVAQIGLQILTPSTHGICPQPGQEAVKKTVRTFWCHNRGLSPTATKTDAAAAIYPYVFALLPRLMPPLRLGTGPMLVLLVLFGNSLFRPSQTAGEGS
jgi:hypothetical protein